jgi:hypothetical protein
VEVVVEPEVGEHHWEELPAGSDDGEQVAVEETDREVDEDLAEGARETYHEHFPRKHWVLHDSSESAIAMDKVVKHVEANVCEQLNKVVREH